MGKNTSRDRILRQAKKLFTSKGFVNTSVREICEEADVKPPAIYYHSGYKQGLFKSVAEEALRCGDEPQTVLPQTDLEECLGGGMSWIMTMKRGV